MKTIETTQHTSGPWRMGTEQGFCMANIYAGKCMNIATVNVFGCPPEQEANARLIAAAPELLDALWDMYALATMLAESHEPTPASTAAIARAKSALARAEGRA